MSAKEDNVKRILVVAGWGFCFAIVTSLVPVHSPNLNPTVALAQTTTQKKLLIVNLNGMPAKVTTDIGVQTSLFEGQLAFMQTRNSAGQIAVALKSFNLIGRPVQTKLGSSDQISVRLEKGSAITRSFDLASGSVVVD